MTRYVLRQGKSVEADAVFDAWTSGDLTRMISVLDEPTNPIERHFLLQGIVGQTYKLRKLQPRMAQLCVEVGLRHLKEFPQIAPVLAEDMGGVLPRVPSFTWLAKVLQEQGRFSEAVQVCEAALRFGLRDGTKGGYEGRIERLHKRITA